MWVEDPKEEYVWGKGGGEYPYSHPMSCLGGGGAQPYNPYMGCAPPPPFPAPIGLQNGWH